MLRRTSVICLEVVVGVVAVTGLLLAASAWRLSQAPVSVKSLLPYAVKALEESAANVRVEIGDLVLTWAGWERALDLRATGIRIRSLDGSPVARIREASVSLSVRALAQGIVAPTSIELIRPRLRIVRTERGTFEAGLGEGGLDAGGATASGAQFLPVLLDELSGPPQREGSLRYLQRVSLVDAAVRLEDRQLGMGWGASQADITFSRAVRGLLAHFEVELDLPASRPMVVGDAVYDKEVDRVSADFNFSRLDPGALAARFDALKDAAALETVLSGGVSLAIGTDGAVQRGEFSIDGNAGSFAVPGVDAPPISFESLSVAGRINRNPDQLQISLARVDFGATAGTVSGIVTRVGDVAAVNATVNIERLPLNALGNYWLPGTGGGARPWVLENMRDGLVTELSASVTARTLLAGDNAGDTVVDSANGRFSVAGASLHYLRPLPPVRDLDATATFSLKRFDVAVQSGRVGALEIGEGAVNIWDIGAPREMLSVSTVFRGPVREMLRLLAHPRLDLLSGVGLGPDEAEGTHRTRLSVTLPLLDDVRMEDVEISASSKITGLTLPDVAMGHGITDGSLDLDVTGDGLKAAGTVRYQNVPVTLNLEEDFAGEGVVRSRLRADLTVGRDLRQLFGLDYPELLEGELPTRLVYEIRRDGIHTLSAGMNLQPAKLAIPAFGWAKLPGREGSAKFTAVFENERIARIPSFEIEAGVFRAEGDVGFADDGETVQFFRLGSFALGSTAFSATAERQTDDVLMIAVEGSGFDVTPLIEQRSPESGDFDLPAFQLSGEFEKVWVGPGGPVTDVTIALERDAEHWQRIDVTGVLPESGKEIRLAMTPTPEGHELEFHAADAGKFLQAFNIYATFLGGSIDVRASRTGDASAPWKGTANMKRFRVTDAPNLARLLTLASLTGISDLLSGRGMAFAYMTMEFEYGDGILTIRDMQAVGSELGLTASGTVDIASDVNDITGTIIPAYTINSLLGRLPVIGPLFSGEKGGGVFAVSFALRGPRENPDISVNPLSALAPGILRKLLGPAVSPGDGGPAPAAPPDPQNE